MKVACLNKISPFGLTRFTNGYELTEEVNDADLILVRSFNMLEMELPEKLLAVARAGAGVNNIPLADLASKGIVVFNTPGANANGVKELVIAGMLLAARDIVGGVNWVRDNKEDANLSKSVEKAKSAFGGTEIIGKKLGVIGLGAVGGKVAEAAICLGMSVLGYDPYLSPENADKLPNEVELTTELDRIYATCDYITLHLPLLDSTRHMIAKDVFAIMKPGVVLLNFSRDQLVNDDDLAISIESGIVRSYVTDFPNPKTANMNHVIAIPHLGASTEESEDNCAMMATDELMRYVEHGSIKNSVNFPALDPGRKQNKYRIQILYKDSEEFLGSLTRALEGIVSLGNLINRAKNGYGVAVVDFDAETNEAAIEISKKMKGVLRVRTL